jgi:hypothetical protein
MLRVRRRLAAPQDNSRAERCDPGVSRFGIIHHGLAWQCRLDATGDSWLRLAHERKPRGTISAQRIQAILSSSDDVVATADAVIAEFLRRTRRHLPHELVAQIRGFTMAWVRDAHRLVRRQRRQALAFVQDDRPAKFRGSAGVNSA